MVAPARCSLWAVANDIRCRLTPTVVNPGGAAFCSPLFLVSASGALAFQPDLCPAGSFVSGVFSTTEVTEVTEAGWGFVELLRCWQFGGASIRASRGRQSAGVPSPSLVLSSPSSVLLYPGNNPEAMGGAPAVVMGSREAAKSRRETHKFGVWCLMGEPRTGVRGCSCLADCLTRRHAGRFVFPSLVLSSPSSVLQDRLSVVFFQPQRSQSAQRLGVAL